MSNKHTYVLGINAYDHDVSACLLRDGEIAVAINKERITRKKHASGFYQEVVDYCLAAEGISLDDGDRVVRTCYVLQVEDLELRLVSQYVPEVMDEEERKQAKNNPLYLSNSNKVVTVSHHLAHAYSAFAACPFDKGVVMVVDGVGNYSSDIAEPGQLTENVNPLARESESYYRFDGARIETLKKVWLKQARGGLSGEGYFMPGPGAGDGVLSGRMVREAGCDTFWIQPAAGDDGIAIGCAYYGYLALLKKPRSSVMTHAFLGAPYSDEDARAAADTWLVRLQTMNTPSNNICRDTARLLSEGHVFAWFQGRSEFGPRALGNRSILADPRKAEMKDKLNKRVKHRQAFRPFAPVVLAERANEIFEGDEESPFMLLVKRVRPQWRDRIPAIVHVDGTARVQTGPQDPNQPPSWIL